MKNKTLIKFSLMLFALILLCSHGAFAQTTDCAKKTDKQIVLEIYKKIKVKYAKQIKHINVIYKDGEVTLQGWVTLETVKMKIEGYATNNKCVKKVVNQLSTSARLDCGKDTKECGGICIGLNEPCNVCLVDPNAKGCN